MLLEIQCPDFEIISQNKIGQIKILFGHEDRFVIPDEKI